MNRILSLITLCALCASSAVAAQTDPVPTDPPQSRTLPTGAVNPLVTYHMTRYRIDKASAEERVAIQGDILQVLENPAFYADANFAGIAVQHEPVYKVYLTYFDNDSKAEKVALIPSRLRRYVQVRKARFDKAGREKRLAQLNTSLAASGVDFVAFYGEVDERFYVHTPSDQDVARLEALVPKSLQADTQVLQRDLPRPEQTSGQKGYSVLAGHMLNPGCTLGFSITYTHAGISGRKGILTAGHCTDDGAVRTINWSDGTKTSFDRAVWSINTGNYDFGIYDLTGIPTDYRIFYRNNVSYGGYTNTVPQFPASGTLNTKNFIRQSASWVGMNVCKHGTFTGLTCGQINSLTYPWRGTSTTFVYVDQSQQQNLSTSGDSGGPWFTWTNPSQSTDVSALGVHVAGSGAGYGGSGIYMPIDRIFNAFTGGPSNVQLVTTPW